VGVLVGARVGGSPVGLGTIVAAGRVSVEELGIDKTLAVEEQAVRIDDPKKKIRKAIWFGRINHLSLNRTKPIHILFQQMAV